ncbi:MAG: DUF4363 family protein [Clostridia bacterium]|nr:DUF4363 family protein [Clostridia bacterium]
MRGFIITSCLFIALLICVFLNYNYINTVHSTMHEMVAQLSSEPSEYNDSLIKELQKYWDKKSTIISISVSFREIDDLTNTIDSLAAANQQNDCTQFAIQKELVENAINAVIRLEQFSIKNIL